MVGREGYAQSIPNANSFPSGPRPRLANPLNYARNYLPELMKPCVNRVIYLDTDLVLTGLFEFLHTFQY